MSALFRSFMITCVIVWALFDIFKIQIYPKFLSIMMCVLAIDYLLSRGWKDV